MRFPFSMSAKSPMRSFTFVQVQHLYALKSPTEIISNCLGCSTNWSRNVMANQGTLIRRAVRFPELHTAGLPFRNESRIVKVPVKLFSSLSPRTIFSARSALAT
jgi:hypothetical protein